MTMGDVIEVLEGPWDLVECETIDERGDAICSIWLRTFSSPETETGRTSRTSSITRSRSS